MTYGYYRGGGFGRGGGMGFGFRGSSPPWPYVGRGRGGLPRCGYYLGGAGTPSPLPYQAASAYSGTPSALRYEPRYSRIPREQELEFLKSEAQTLRNELKELDSQIEKLSAEQKKETK